LVLIPFAAAVGWISYGRRSWSTALYAIVAVVGAEIIAQIVKRRFGSQGELRVPGGARASLAKACP
jgi:CDP-diglyceride synthetase